MVSTNTPKTSRASLAEVAQALSRIARELSQVSCALAADAGSDAAEPESRPTPQETATALSSHPSDHLHLQETPHGQTARLRKEILEALMRRGPALPIELAATTLSLPEEIQPVLKEMDREGLIQIRVVQGGQLVTLTAKGRLEVRG